MICTAPAHFFEQRCASRRFFGLTLLRACYERLIEIIHRPTLHRFVCFSDQLGRVVRKFKKEKSAISMVVGFFFWGNHLGAPSACCKRSGSKLVRPLYSSPRPPTSDSASDAAGLRTSVAREGIAAARANALRLGLGGLRFKMPIGSLIRAKRIGDLAQLGNHLGELTATWRSTLARDELLEISGRRRPQADKAFLSARDFAEVAKLAYVLQRVMVIAEPARAGRDRGIAFRPADQVHRPGDPDAPLAKCRINRLRFEVETSAASCC
jgi:hypothetical protein